jgi:hypothetical protein
VVGEEPGEVVSPVVEVAVRDQAPLVVGLAGLDRPLGGGEEPSGAGRGEEDGPGAVRELDAADLPGGALPGAVDGFGGVCGHPYGLAVRDGGDHGHDVASVVVR